MYQGRWLVNISILFRRQIQRKREREGTADSRTQCWFPDKARGKVYDLVSVTSGGRFNIRRQSLVLAGPPISAKNRGGLRLFGTVRLIKRICNTFLALFLLKQPCMCNLYLEIVHSFVSIFHLFIALLFSYSGGGPPFYKYYVALNCLCVPMCLLSIHSYILSS